MILIALLFGCIAQSTEKLEQQKAELLNKYEEITNQKEQLQEQYQELQNQKTDLENNYNKLSSANEETNKKYDDLTSLYNELKKINQNITVKYNQLKENYEELERKSIEIRSARLPKDIPTSPSIPDVDFVLSEKALMLKYDKLNLSSVTDTKSMLPTISYEHTAIFTNKFDPKKLVVGNIIAYESDSFDIPIMHRIIEVKNDGSSVCYILQGDNNLSPDPECVKPAKVVGLVVGIIFNKNIKGYNYCEEGSIPVVDNDQIICMSDIIPAGVYINEQKIPTDALQGFTFCAENEPSKPYTVITPN